MRATPWRVGVIGAGFGQHVLVPTFRRDGRADIQALCASTEARARAIADRLAIPKAFGNWRQLVDDPDIDIVAISVPPARQAEIVLAAAATGKHILAEKPLGMNAAEAEAMVTAMRAAGVVGAVDFEFREIEAWRRAQAMLATGFVGKPRRAYLSWRMETYAYRENKVNWKRDPLLGGGVLNLFGSHALDSVLWAFGKVNRLAARLAVPAPGAADAALDAWLEMEAGFSLSLSLAADAPFGSGYRLEVHGDEGALTLANPTSDYATGFTLSVGRRGEEMRPVDLPVPPLGEDGRITATGGVVRRFIDAIQNGTPVAPDFHDGLRVQKLIDAIREADRRTAWLSPN